MTVNEKLCDQLNKIIIFFVQVIALFLKVSQFEQYFAKHGTIQNCQLKNTVSKRKSHKRIHNIKLIHVE